MISLEKSNLPNGWTIAKIDELVSPQGLFCDGDWIESKDQDPNGEVRLIQLADIGDGEFRNKSNRFITKKTAIHLNCTFLKYGDILVARMPEPLGRSCIFPLKEPEAYITAVDVAIIRLVGRNCSNNFLSHLINSEKIRSQILALQSGTTRKRISRANLSKIGFPLPPLPEQHRIVAKIEELFSSLDKTIETLKATQEQLKLYRQAVLKWAFEGRLTNPDVKEGELPEGWMSRTLEEICEMKAGLFIKASDIYSNLKKGLYPCYGGNGLRGYVKSFTHEGKFSLIGRQGALCGNVHLVNAKFHATEHAVVVTAKEGIDTDWLYYKLTSMRLNKYSTGTAQPGLSVNKLLPIEIELPNKNEQNHTVIEIESRLSVCDKIEESIEQSLQQAEALRQSILKKAFEGNLVPQDLNDEPASVLLERIKAERASAEPIKKTRTKKAKA